MADPFDPDVRLKDLELRLARIDLRMAALRYTDSEQREGLDLGDRLVSSLTSIHAELNHLREDVKAQLEQMHVDLKSQLERLTERIAGDRG